MLLPRLQGLLLSLVCLLVGEPLHGWLHAGGDVPRGQGAQLHDGACEHQVDHPSDDDCLMCGGGRSGPAACIDTSVGWQPAFARQQSSPESWTGPPCSSAPHVLGARGPPILG